MKNLFNSAFVACLALAIGLVGCQKGIEQGAGPEIGTKSVKIKIAQDVLTRAAGAAAGVVLDDPITEDVDESQTLAVQFNNGALFFTDGGTVVKRVMIAEDDDTDSDEIFTIEELGSGVVFSNLPAGVDAVYFAANLAAAGATAPETQYNFSTADALKAKEIAVAQLATFTNIPIFGMDESLTDSYPKAGEEEEAEAGDGTLDAEIVAKVVAGRFEIGTIASKAAPDAEYPVIKSFVLDAIYMDYFYPAVQLGGALAQVTEGANKVDVKLQGGEVKVDLDNNPVINNDDYNYPATWHAAGLTADVVGGTAAASFTASYMVGEPAVATPGVWAYNLPAPAAGAAMPYIVLQISGVTFTDDSTLAGIKYLTLKNTNTSMLFEQGNIYKLARVEFNASDLRDWPYAATIDVDVRVSILPWTGVEVDYDFW